uniref:CSON000743 protein n=1 Tax=Culicoides sonorensis TaxID=179676 RepID=A0A336LQ40_CULSO
MAKNFNELIWDYAVFILFLMFSTLAPLWSNLCGNKEKKVKSKANYVFAGSVGMFAMMLSIGRGTLGVRTFIGFPSELYYRGAEMWETLYGYVSAYPVVCFIFIPVYFDLGITSVYQYLDMRFKSRIVRCLAAGSFILRQVMNQGITIYTPTVALNTVIGIPYWASLVGLTVISIIFNLLGGLKHAIKADVIQVFTTIAVTVVIIIQGFYKGGGVAKTITTNKEAGRLEFFNFTGDLTTRVDTLSAWMGQFFISMSLFGCQQNFIQRYLSMPSLKKINKMMMSNIPMITVLFSLSWIAGIGIYATYWNCDPLAAGYIKKKDEIVPFFVEDQFDYLPGFLGLFMACLFNGALALQVSNLNSLATVTWEDFLSPMPVFKKLKDKQQVTIIKFVGTVYAILIMGVGFSVGLLSGVIEASMLMTSSTSGSLLGAFLLAILFPIANWKGTAIGMIIAQITTTWLVWGNLVMGKTKKSLLPTSVEGCTNDTFSIDITKPYYNPWLLSKQPLEITSYTYVTQSVQEPESNSPLVNLFSVSYMYYSVFGTLITVVIGVLISALTQSDEDNYESKLVHPLVYKFTQYLPGKKRIYLDSIVKDNAKINISIENDKKPSMHENLAYKNDESDMNKHPQANIFTITKKINDDDNDLTIQKNDDQKSPVKKISIDEKNHGTNVSETYRRIDRD